MSNNQIWLTILRGAVERQLDNLLAEQSLSIDRTVFENMKPAISNSDDAIFGYIFGRVIGSIEMMFNVLNRQPTTEEMNEVVSAFF